MATLTTFPRFRALDANGEPLSGGKLYTYDAGTTTPKQTFTTQDETATNTNPVILNSEGYADVWLDSGAYKFRLDNSADVTQWTVDDIQGDSATAFGATVVAISSNTTATASDNNTAYWATGTITLNLPSVASSGGGYQLIVKNLGSGTVTIDPNGAETINGSATLDVGADESLVIACDGSEWETYFNVPKASEAEAQAGTSNTVFMTPLRTKDALDALVGRPSFRATTQLQQSLASSTVTVLQLSGETYDTDSAYDNATYRFTPQVAGKYMVGVNLLFSQIPDGVQVRCLVRKNGVGISPGAENISAAASSTLTAFASDIIEMNGSTDYLDFAAEQRDSLPRNVTAYAYAFKLMD